MTIQRENQVQRNPQENLVTKILADLCEITPRRVIPMPNPYNENLTMEQNVVELHYQLRWSLRVEKRIEGLVAAYYLGQYIGKGHRTQTQIKECRKVLTTHYIQCCTRIYDLFSILGIEQIYRTKRITFGMFRTISKRDFVRLTNEAENLFSYDVGTS
jgi:hypothetical protein